MNTGGSEFWIISTLFADDSFRQADGAVSGERSVNLLVFSVIAVVVGAVTGIGAVLFRALIAVVHNLLFLGHFSTVYNANVHTPAAPWGPFVILAPVLGGLVVVFLVRTFAPEARGHGVPEVMDAIFYKEGRIRPVVAAVKSLASALAIGSGSAVGREGPIIQIGASLGSSIGQFIRLEAWQRITLVAAGAGAGIAATFNTPIGGVIFAVELMMPEVSTRTFLPVALATGTATFIGRLFFGDFPAFDVPPVGTLSVQASAAIRSGAVCDAGRGGGSGGSGIHPRPPSCRGTVRSDLKPLSAPCDRYEHRRPDDVCVPSLNRPLSDRRRRVRNHTRRTSWRSDYRPATGVTFRLEAAGDLAQPGIRVIRRDFLSVTVYGRDTRRSIRRRLPCDLSVR